MTGSGPDPIRRLYGRRKGPALRAHQAGLLRDLLPAVAVSPSDARLASPASLFEPEASEVWLEIGFGGGEHLAGLARERPRTGFIGCEPFVNGVAKLLAAIEADGLANIRIHPGDARDILERLGDATIGRVFLLHPDPWPKRRHHKRRFVNRESLREIERILKPGGLFHLASDSSDYIAWSLAEIAAQGGLRRREQADAPAPPTRYAEKGRSAGRPSVRLTFQRAD